MADTETASDVKKLAPPDVGDGVPTTGYKRANFDDLLSSLRAFGPFQRRIFILTSLFDLPGCYVAMFFLFGGYNPGFYCLSSAGSQAFAAGNFSVNDPMQAATWREDQCNVNGSACAAIVFKQGYHSALTEWALVCDYKYITNFFTSLMMFGILLGASFLGHLADCYGRRHVFYGSCALLILSQFALGLSVNWQMFAALRFIGGIAIAGLVCVGYIIPMELIGPEWRTVCGCVGFWQMASLSLAGLGYLIPNWRHLCFVTAAISTPMLISWFFVPESPRWLLQQNRIPEALTILRQMARVNGRPEPTEEELTSLPRSEGSSGHSVRDMFRTRTLTVRTLLMAFTWLMCNMGTYGLAMATRDMGGNIYLNVVLLSITEFVFVFSVIFTAKWFGRRPTLLGYEAIAGVSLIMVVALQMSDVDGNVLGAVAAVGRASVMASWYIAYLLTAELFPTLIRSLANGSCSVFGRIGGILAPQVAYLMHINPALPGIIYGLFIIGAMVASTILLPETKGKPLPDVLPPRLGCCTSAPLKEEPYELSDTILKEGGGGGGKDMNDRELSMRL